MKKINIYDTSKLTATDLSEMQLNFNSSLETFCSSEFGIVKSGMNLTLINEQIKISLGVGFTSSGKIIKLNEDIYTKIDKEKITFISMVQEKLEGVETAKVKLITYSDIELKDPYKLSIFDNKDQLIIGFIENKKVYELNHKEQISEIEIGQVFSLNQKNEEFRDYVTFRGCVKLTEYSNKYIKFDENLNTGGLSEFLIQPQHLPTFGSSTDHFVNGITDKDGSHTHEYDTLVRYDGWFNSNEDWQHLATGYTDYNGEHFHKYNLKYNNSNQTPIKLEPNFVSLLLIKREY